MNIKVNGKDATPEQQLALKKLGKKYMFKSFLTVIHCAAIALMLNLILVMATATYAENSTAIPFLGGLFIAIFVFRKLGSTLAQHGAKMSEEIKAILQ